VSSRPPWRVDLETSLRLARIPQSKTTPELTVRRAVTLLGIRYRLNCRKLPGAPDLASLRGKWAIFVHGCFWHNHEGCRRATVPKRNRRLWRIKFRQNRKRDELAVRNLEALGFRVLVLWECEVLDPLALVDRLTSFFELARVEIFARG
jgi:DNA mismatch endonuclease (patch repair protein)